MRYARAIVAVVVLACGVSTYADLIKMREGGDETPGEGYTDVTFDDTYNVTNSADTNYGTGTDMRTKRLINQGALISYMLIGVKPLFTELPKTSGGDTIVIDNAVLRIWRADTTTDGGATALYRVTTDWLLSAAGTNETNVTHNERDAAGDLSWAGGGSFGDSDFDALDNVTWNWSINNVDPRLMELTITHIVAKIYELEQNYGFMIRSEQWNGAEHKAYTSESTTDTWGGLNAHPELIIEYHYESSVIPEPGTMLLVGTGVLAAIGYFRRRRMR